MANTTLDSVLGEFENNGITRDPKSDPDVRNLHERLHTAITEMTDSEVEPRLESLKRNPEYWLAKTVQYVAKHGAAPISYGQGDPLLTPLVIGMVDYGGTSYQLTAAKNPNGTGTLLSWTWPDSFSPTPMSEGDPVFPVTAYYLQRSTTALNMPYAEKTPENTKTLTQINTTLAQPGWQTIATWGPAGDLNALATPNPKNGSPTSTYIDITPPPTTGFGFAYRLIGVFNTFNTSAGGGTYDPDSPGDGADAHRTELDWNVVTAVSAAPGTPVWAQALGSTGVDYGMAVCTDTPVLALSSQPTEGNSYVALTFTGTVNFGNGHSLTSAGSLDVAVCKFDIYGVCQWATRIGGVAGDVPKAICLGPSDVSTGLCDVFVAVPLSTGIVTKLNGSGVVQWTKGPVANSSPHIQSVAPLALSAGGDGSVVCTGTFVAQFDNLMNFGDGHSLASVSGSTDAFLAKYNTSGTCVFARGFDNYGDTEFGTAVVVDRNNSDNILLAGYNLSGMWTSSDSSLSGTFVGNVGAAGACGYIMKLDSSGVIIGSSARNVGNNNGTDAGYSRINSLVLRPDGVLVVCGACNGKISFGGPYRQPQGTQQAGFIAAYRLSDLAYQWDTVFTPTFYVDIRVVACDRSGVLYATGSFTRSTNFGGTTLTSYTDAGYTSDVFVMRLTSAGAVTWVLQYGGSDNDLGNGLALDAANCPIVSGGFLNNVNGTPANFISTNLTSHGDVDCFLMRLVP